MNMLSVLFLCADNARLSVYAEALLKAMGSGRFLALSAGSDPAAVIDTEVVRMLQTAGLPTDGLRPKSWLEFAVPGAPTLNYVVTLCDQVAAQPRPNWPGQPWLSHWSLPQPSTTHIGSGARQRTALEPVVALRRRIELLASLPQVSLDRLQARSLQQARSKVVPFTHDRRRWMRWDGTFESAPRSLQATVQRSSVADFAEFRTRRQARI